MKVILHDIRDLLAKTLKKTGKDDIFTFAAAIAFYTIFSLAPMLVLIVSLGSLFLSEQTLMEQIQFLVGNLLDDSTIQTLNSYVIRRFDEGTGFLTSAIALITIMFGATTVISQLKTALNKIWNVREIRIHSVWNFIFNRLLSFGMILIFCFLLILSLMTEAALGIVGDFLTRYLPGMESGTIYLTNQIATAVLAILSFTLVFKILPDVHARWLDVLVGASVTTLLFLLGKYLLGIYFSASGINAAYRAAGSLIIFVIWVYYNILIVLFGAVFTQVYTEKYGTKITPYKFVTLEDMPDIDRRSG